MIERRQDLGVEEPARGTVTHWLLVTYHVGNPTPDVFDGALLDLVLGQPVGIIELEEFGLDQLDALVPEAALPVLPHRATGEMLLQDKDPCPVRVGTPDSSLCPSISCTRTRDVVRVSSCPFEKEKVCLTTNSSPERSCSASKSTFSDVMYKTIPMSGEP